MNLNIYNLNDKRLSLLGFLYIFHFLVSGMRSAKHQEPETQTFFLLLVNVTTLQIQIFGNGFGFFCFVLDG